MLGRACIARADQLAAAFRDAVLYRNRDPTNRNGGVGGNDFVDVDSRPHHHFDEIKLAPHAVRSP